MSDLYLLGAYFQNKEKEDFNIFRSDIIEYFVFNDWCKTSDVATFINRPVDSTNFYLKSLENEGVLTSSGSLYRLSIPYLNSLQLSLFDINSLSIEQTNYAKGNKKKWGEGSYYIITRKVNRNGKDYKQYYFSYQIGKKKKSKYLPKSKLKAVQTAISNKLRIKDILSIINT